MWEKPMTRNEMTRIWSCMDSAQVLLENHEGILWMHGTDGTPQGMIVDGALSLGSLQLIVVCACACAIVDSHLRFYYYSFQCL
jgi:hypothetical protein